MRPELPTAVAVDNSASIQPARSIFISWGKSVQISGATSHIRARGAGVYFFKILTLFLWNLCMNFLNKTVAFVCCAVAAATSPAWAKDNVERAGDFLQVLVPAVGYGMTFYKGDDEGRTQFYKSFAATVGATQLLKSTIDATRPNGGGRSFPSGHTSAAFQGAAFIHARYGIEQAWPAYAAAAFVGYSRVDSDNHHTRDVIAGAALGIAASFYFTPERFGAKQAVIMPYTDGKQVGVVWMRPLQ
jgi:membrane-associated phospholipid phosphatase